MERVFLSFVEMLCPAVLKIYNASAGSGKTYILVSEYLSVLLQEQDPYRFRRILAVTFTNKAAKEMKSRILQSLKTLAEESIRDPNGLLFSNLSETLGLSPEQLQYRAKGALRAILHDYANFSISTIDKFTHKIIRTFTSDLGLSETFEVEMEAKRLLREAVEVLLSELDHSKKSSQILIQFALEKLDNGNSWNPTEDLMRIATLLIEEQSILPLKKLKCHSLDDFLSLGKLLKQQIRQIKEEFKTQADVFFNQLQEAGISRDSFYHSLLPNFFNKLSRGDIFKTPFEDPFNKTLVESMNAGRFYAKTKDVAQKALIDAQAERWASAYQTARDTYFKRMPDYMLANLLQKNFTLLATSHELDQVLKTLKSNNNILFNAELNKLISDEIHGQPLPYFYERLGERYQHYFIDEFQDTSRLQWRNLQPLVENALSENGTALLVGDAKQSIYRWRGGEAEQFIELIEHPSKAYIKEVETLGINFRSCEQIVRFNNALYSSAAHTLDDAVHKKNYAETTLQHPSGKLGGYVELNFLYKDTSYFEQTYQALKTRMKGLLDQGYRLADIAVLVRKNEEGAFLAQAFSHDGIAVCSSESLLLKNAWPVRCIVNLFRILSNTDDPQARVDWLLLLIQNGKITPSDAHDFLLEMTALPLESFFEKLDACGLSFERQPQQVSSLYDLAEMAVRAMRLGEGPHMATVQFFLDFVFRTVQRSGNSTANFLEHWNTRKDKESVVSSENLDAIRIMTIHKSKGLQFPAVLLPFVHWKAFHESGVGAWLDIDPQVFNGFDTFYVTIQSFMSRIGGTAQALYKDHSAKICFDHLNLLYVATTRAVEQLIIFARDEVDTDDTIAFYLKHYLRQENLWVEGQRQYVFGTPQKGDHVPIGDPIPQKTTWVSEPWQSRVSFKSVLSESSIEGHHQIIARSRGDLVHKVLSTIRVASDLQKALKKLRIESLLSDEEHMDLERQLSAVMDHPELKHYYQMGSRIFCERELLFQGQIFRPDRVVFSPEDTVVIDYKTGEVDQRHRDQLSTYMQALSTMDHSVIKGLLVYTGDTLKVISIKLSP